MVPIYFFGAAVISGALYLNNNRTGLYGLMALYLVLLIGLDGYAWRHYDELLYGYFRADALGLLFLNVLVVLSIAAVIHSLIYAHYRADPPRTLAIHFCALTVFITMMSGVLLSAHVGVLWAFLEATTLAASTLIYFHRHALSLEATWKYLFVCSIGITLAFAGILFLGIATQQAESLDLSLEALRVAAPSMDPVWLQVCFLFILAGFSVKMGLAPLFNVDIDAKDLSPSPIGGLFSSALMNTGFVSIFRFYECFSGTSILPWMNRVLLFTGFISILFAAIYIIRVKRYKRLFAYSSLEHAGLVMLGLASGGVGYFAAIFHLLLHSLAKASLFFQLGQIYRTFRTKRIDDIGGYFKVNPYGSVILILGFLSITAMPPTGLFISEYLTFKAMILSGHLWLAIPTFVLLLFILGALSQHIFSMLFGLPLIAAQRDTTLKPLESATGWLFLGLVVVFGLYLPPFLSDLIGAAIHRLP